MERGQEGRVAESAVVAVLMSVFAPPPSQVVPASKTGQARKKTIDAHQQRMCAVLLAIKCPEDFTKDWGFMESIFAYLERPSSDMTLKNQTSFLKKRHWLENEKTGLFFSRSEDSKNASASRGKVRQNDG